MRHAPLLLVLLVLAPPVVTAVPVLDDAEGDVRAFADPDGTDAGAEAPVDLAVAPTVDLRALDVTEDADVVRFTLAVTDLDRADALATFHVDFKRGSVAYRVLVFYGSNGNTGEPFAVAFLQVRDASGRYGDREDVPVTVDAPAGTLTLDVPRVLLLDEADRPPARGDALADVTARALATAQVNDARVGVRDSMPDAGDAPGAFTFTLGDAAAGHLRLASTDPVRVSNGAATTFVYSATLVNDGDAADTVRLNVTGVPDGWVVRVEPERRVPAGESRPVVVLATVPFRHEHGGFEAFNVTATSSLAPNVTARHRFGVLFTPVPQPTGHHPALFLHARHYNGPPFDTVFPYADAWLSTLAPEDADAERTLPNRYVDGHLVWHLPLAPALATGLDFDTTGTGTLAFALSGGSGDATVRASLVLEDEDGAPVVTLADGAPTVLALDPTSPVPVTLPLAPTPDAEYVPYARGRNLALVVTLEDAGGAPCCFPAQTSPGVHVDGFSLDLPLTEYHDRLDDIPGLDEGVTIEAEGPVNRTAVPGVTLTYPFEITHRGARSERYNVSVAGADADATSVVPREPVTLEPFESRRVLLAVHVPLTANPGEVLEALLVVTSETDPGKVALARTMTRVDPEADFVDETRLLVEAEGRERPTPPVGALGALLVLVLTACGTRARARP